MKNRKATIQKRFFDASIDLLIYNPVSQVPYLAFIVIDFFFKSIYGVAFIFNFVGRAGFSKLQDPSIVLYCNYCALGLLGSTVLLFIWKMFLKPDSTNVFSSLLRRYLAAVIVSVTLFLAVPIQVSALQAIRMGLDDQRFAHVGIHEVILGLLTFIVHLVVYLYSETFRMCYFPNTKVPWSKPSVSMNILGYLSCVAHSVLLIFDHENIKDDIIVFIAITILHLISASLQWVQIPCYSRLVDTALLWRDAALAFTYLMTTTIALQPGTQGKISIGILYIMTLAILLGALYKSKQHQQQHNFLHTTKNPKQLKLQLVQLIRLSRSSKLDLIVQLQGWILQHHRSCTALDCACSTINLSHIRNIADASMLRSRDSSIPEIVPLREAKHFTPTQSEFFVSQYLDQDSSNASENQREQELRHLKKLQQLVLQLLSTEIQNCVKTDNQLQLLKISADINLKSQSFKAFFKILQLQQQLTKLTMKQNYVLAYLKKHLINKIDTKDRFHKKDSQKTFIINQLKYEQGFHSFLMDIQSITDLADSLWKQSANRNYKILTMNGLMEKISEAFIKLWAKYQEQEEKYMNPELLMILARFCDLVLGFELEAESLYMKGASLLHSLKLQQSKGLAQNGEIDTRSRTQEFLISVECTPKALDRISFVNQKLLNFTGFKLEDLVTIKSLLPPIIASFHDEKIVKYLQKQEKASGVITVDSWMLVKKGYAVPVQLRSIPHIDIKHDFRFISQIKVNNELDIEDTRLQYNQVFVFLTCEFGQIDSVSKECFEVLSITPKMIELGLTIQQILVGFDYQRLSNYQQGQGFMLNKTFIREIQQQLDMEQNEQVWKEMDNSFNMLKRPSTFTSMKNSSIDPFQQNTWMKVFVKSGTKDNHEKRFYEVIAIPYFPDPELNQGKDFESGAFDHISKQQISQVLGKRFYHIQSQDPRDITKIEEDDDEDLADKEEKLQQELASLSSVTSSQSSKNDKQFQLVRDIKEIIQLKHVPQIIVKLRRSLHVFFFIMMVTAIVLMIVNIVDKVFFERDIQAVDQAFMIQYYIANIRLRFQTLYVWSNKNATLNTTEQHFYSRNQHQFGLFIEDFRTTIRNLNTAVQYLPDDLKGQFFDDDLNISYISKINEIYNRTISFQSGAQEIIQTADQYQYINSSQLRINRSIFGVRYGAKNTTYRLSDDEQNSFLIMTNLATNLRFKADEIEKTFSQEVVRFGENSQRNILIFTMVCMSIVILSSILIMPILFQIDNTLSESVKSWTQIKQDQKEEQIVRISIFKEMLSQASHEKGKGNRKNKLEQIIKKHQQLKSKALAKSGLSSTESLKANRINVYKGKMEQIIEEEFKEEEEYKQHSGGKKKKLNEKAIEHLESKSNVNKKGESDSEEDSNANQTQAKSKNENSESNQIHTQSQLIALDGYILARKVKMGTIIGLFSAIICCLYGGSYILATKLYDETLHNFQTLTTISGRTPCPSRVLFFMVNKYLSNQTYIDDPSIGVSFLVSRCLEVESKIREMKRYPSVFYQQFQSQMDDVDSDQFCNYYEKNVVKSISRNDIEAQELSELCRTISQGALKLGAAQAIPALYKQVEQDNIIFINSKAPTVQTLNSLLFDDKFQTFIMRYTYFVGPTLFQIYNQANEILYQVMNADYVNLIVMFVVFIVFLIVTWGVSVGILIMKLSQTLNRAKISVKMIPASILIEIKEAEKDQQNYGIRKIKIRQNKERRQNRV